MDRSLARRNAARKIPMDQGLTRAHAASLGGFEGKMQMIDIHGHLSSVGPTRQVR